MPQVLVVDNYDSFTYNLVQALAALGADVDVRRNDELFPETLGGAYSHVVVSPGPGRPEGAGASMRLIRTADEEGIPLLGVCLGHQALAAVFGSVVTAADELMHGKTSSVYHDGRGIFEGLPNPFEAGRYHSLAVPEDGLSDRLAITAYTSSGEIMGLRHRVAPLSGVQFHPESILTPDGERLLRNFLRSDAREAVS